MNNFFNPPANVRLLDLEQRTPQWHAWRDGVDLPDGTRLEALLANSAPGRARFFDVGDRVRLSWQAEAGAFLDA